MLCLRMLLKGFTVGFCFRGLNNERVEFFIGFLHGLVGACILGMTRSRLSILSKWFMGLCKGVYGLE